MFLFLQLITSDHTQSERESRANNLFSWIAKLCQPQRRQKSCQLINNGTYWFGSRRQRENSLSITEAIYSLQLTRLWGMGWQICGHHERPYCVQDVFQSSQQKHNSLAEYTKCFQLPAALFWVWFFKVDKTIVKALIRLFPKADVQGQNKMSVQLLELTLSSWN